MRKGKKEQKCQVEIGIQMIKMRKEVIINVRPVKSLLAHLAILSLTDYAIYAKMTMSQDHIKKGATMKALILGKERQLTKIDSNGLFFLADPKDMSETGIYTGETIESWGDEAYLNRIRAHEPVTFSKSLCPAQH